MLQDGKDATYERYGHNPYNCEEENVIFHACPNLDECCFNTSKISGLSVIPFNRSRKSTVCCPWFDNVLKKIIDIESHA
jgi:hypothetical protein